MRQALRRVKKNSVFPWFSLEKMVDSVVAVL
jgi:hypothetical protein